MWGEKAGWKTSDGEQPHEANSLRLDSSKARARLGWRPRWNLLSALEETAVWYRAYQDQKTFVTLCWNSFRNTVVFDWRAIPRVRYRHSQESPYLLIRHPFLKTI